MKLVLDSNIFIADVWLRGTQFAVLKDGIQRIDSELLVSEVVIAEVKAKYRERLVEALSAEEKAARGPDVLSVGGQVGLSPSNGKVHVVVGEGLTWRGTRSARCARRCPPGESMYRNTPMTRPLRMTSPSWA